MNRRREKHRGLTNTRIYQKRQRFYLFNPEPIAHPDTGKVSKWHSLCNIADGEDTARELANKIIKGSFAAADSAAGDMSAYLAKYELDLLTKRQAKLEEMKTEKGWDPAREQMHHEGTKEIRRILSKIVDAFQDFDVAQPIGVDIATFVDNWQGQRMAQVYLSRLSDFFRWCIRKGYRTDNPCDNIRVEKPKPRRRYVSDQEFLDVLDAVLVGDDGKRLRSGPLARCYFELCYVLYQRSTEIRLLRRSQLKRDGIEFKPTKTQESSGLSVIVPYTPEILQILRRAEAAAHMGSIYVFHNEEGQPYTAHGLHTFWDRGCKRAGVEDATVKDLRAKALTDAKKRGYKIEQIQIAAVHADVSMTETYIKDRITPVSEVVLDLPKRSNTA